MMISDLEDHVTRLIQVWIAVGDDDDGSGTGFAVQRYGRSEARDSVLATDDDTAGGESLRGWFLDRLTIDPGVPGAFVNLAADLLSTTLDLADWPGLSAWVRRVGPDFRTLPETEAGDDN